MKVKKIRLEKINGGLYVKNFELYLPTKINSGGKDILWRKRFSQINIPNEQNEIKQSSTFSEKICNKYVGIFCSESKTISYPADNAYKFIIQSAGAAGSITKYYESRTIVNESLSWWELTLKQEQEIYITYFESNATRIIFYNEQNEEVHRRDLYFKATGPNQGASEEIKLPVISEGDVIITDCSSDALYGNDVQFRYSYRTCTGLDGDEKFFPRGGSCLSKNYILATPSNLSSFPVSLKVKFENNLDTFIKIEPNGIEPCYIGNQKIQKKDSSGNDILIVPNIGIFKEPSQWSSCTNELEKRTWSKCTIDNCSSNTYTENQACKNGELSSWSSWNCDQNTKKAIRTRSCIPPLGSGLPCPSGEGNELSETVDCKNAEYSKWEISGKCLNNQIQMSRTCIEGTYGGIPCDNKTLRTVSECANAIISDWSEWSPCENGIRKRNKTCKPPINGGLPCPNDSKLVETESCNESNIYNSYIILIIFIIIFIISSSISLSLLL